MYTEKQLSRARVVVLATWIFGGLAFFPPLAGSPVGVLGRALFGILFCVHLVEFAFFRKIYAEAGGPMSNHFLRHMAYGVIYKTEVEQGRAGD